MLFSSNFLKNSVENYKNAKNIEKFTSNNKLDNGNNNKSSNLFFYTFLLIISFLFFILELFLLYFAICVAIYCSQSREERIINIILACTFTLPYILIKITFDDCSKNYIKNGMKL